METALDHKSNHPRGQESHGVHLCHKCGWPFPNPHPSAKHRRAHKKICGTIEGYRTTVDSGDKTTHSAVSDDDDHSDEDLRTTPSPRGLERSVNEKVSGGIGERSSSAEDEIFADAATEFTDGGSIPATEKSLEIAKEQATNGGTIAKNDTKPPSSDGNPIADIVPPPSNSADSHQMQTIECPGSKMSGSEPKVQDHDSSTVANLMEKPALDGIHDESAYVANDGKGGSASDSNPILIERQDGSREIKQSNDGGDLTKNKAEGSEEINLDGHCEDVAVLSIRDSTEKAGTACNLEEEEYKTSDTAANLGGVQSKEEHNYAKGNEDESVRLPMDVLVPNSNDMEASEAMTKLEKTVDMNSDSEPVAGVVQLKEDNTFELDSMIPINDYLPEAKSEEIVNASVNTAEIKVDDPVANDSADSGDSIEGYKGTGEYNEKSYVLSVPEAIPVVDNAETMIKGFKDYKVGNKPQVVNAESFEVISSKTVAASEDNHSCSQAGLLNEAPAVSASVMHDLKEDLAQKDGNSKPIVEESCDEEEAGVPQTNVMVSKERSEELVAPGEALPIEMEQSRLAKSPKEELPCDHRKDSLIATYSERSTEVLPSVNPIVAMDDEVRQPTNIVDTDNLINDEKAMTERHDIAGNDDEKRITESSAGSITAATSDPPTVLPELEDHARTSMVGGDNSALSMVEEGLSVKTMAAPEPGSDLHESPFCESVTNTSEMNLPQTECMHKDGVSDAQKGWKEPEGNANDKVPAECVGGVSGGTVAVSGEVVLTPKFSKDHEVKEDPISLIDTSPSIQLTATVEDNHARDFVGVASMGRSDPIPDEADNTVIAQQLGASANDFSVDSSSQTDSLEGHWGSVSVLSTQSDIPAFLDAEPSQSASAEVEKASSKNQRIASESQHSDKSDLFEPPSFMTLVEPRGGADKKVSGSEANKAQNPDQEKGAASLQAGWFPSITHVVNESQGRKKNEEIIAKVTKWSTGKQHTPLKNLLGEARSPNAKENPAPFVQSDETKLKDNGASATTVSSILGPEAPISEVAKKEAGKEWNSPARYPTDIKREKRKVKGRPYWAQFMCCSSSVN